MTNPRPRPISKSEALELLIGEMADQLRKECAAAEEREKKAEAALDNFTLDSCLDLFKGAKVSTSRYGRKEDEETSLRVEISVKTRRLPPAIRAAIVENRDAYKAKCEVQERRRELFANKQQLKNEMLRTILEATPAGQKFLRQLGDMKLRVSRKLLSKKEAA